MENWEMLLFGVTIVIVIRLFVAYKIRAAKKNEDDRPTMHHDAYRVCKGLGNFSKTLDFSLGSLQKWMSS